jgi:hypothetical protein
MFAQALDRNLNLQRYNVLYISGKYSSILSKPRSPFPGPGDPPGLYSIPAHDHSGRVSHNLIIIKHDPLFNEDATGMIDLATGA